MKMRGEPSCTSAESIKPATDRLKNFEQAKFATLNGLRAAADPSCLRPPF